MNCIELIKQGNFYVAFKDSAVLIHYFFDYKLMSSKYGTSFPVSCLEKVVSTLNNYKISYVIKEKDKIVNSKDFKKANKYNDYIDKANEKLEIETRLSLLEYKIKNLNNSEILHLIEVVENEIRK